MSQQQFIHYLFDALPQYIFKYSSSVFILLYSTFDFEATNAAIAVTGSVIVKFAGRRLTVDIDRLLQAANDEETASFDVNVQLASEPELALEGGEEVMMNSANAAAGKAFAILGMVFASAFALF